MLPELFSELDCILSTALNRLVSELVPADRIGFNGALIEGRFVVFFNGGSIDPARTGCDMGSLSLLVVLLKFFHSLWHRLSVMCCSVHSFCVTFVLIDHFDHFASADHCLSCSP